MTKTNEKIQQICSILLLTKQQVVDAIEESDFLADSNYTKGTAAFDMRRHRLLQHLKQGDAITGFTLESGGNDLTFSDMRNGVSTYYRFFGREAGQSSARKWLKDITGNGMGDLFAIAAASYYGVFFDRLIDGELYIVFELRDGYNNLIIEYVHGADEVLMPDEFAAMADSGQQQPKAAFTDKQQQKKIE